MTHERKAMLSQLGLVYQNAPDGWLTSNRDALLTILEAKSPRSRRRQTWCLGRLSSWFTDAVSGCVPKWRMGGRGCLRPLLQGH